MKVSFDYDDTLSFKYFQDYAKELIEQGVDVHITTSRYDTPEKYEAYKTSKEAVDKVWNELFETAEKVGIKKENIHFTNMNYKSYFLKEQDFIFHIDDNWDEIGYCLKAGVEVVDSLASDCIEKCNKLIKEYQKNADNTRTE
jgi:sugar phosphate isomerase/epimerase